MFKVLLVDDEPAAMKSIKYLIDWESCGFQINGEAANGEEAVRLFSEQGFDLVITDIRMPVMDGLQLISHLREISSVPVFIVSGYEDFQYARQGIVLGVKEYLLKPVDANELAERLSSVKQLLERESLHEQKLYHGLPLMREQLLSKWVRGELNNPDYFIQLGILPDIGEDFFCVVMAEMTAMVHDLDGQETGLKRFAVRNVLEESCKDAGLLFTDTPFRYGILCWGNASTASIDALLRLAERMIESVVRYTKETIDISIGPVVSSRSEVSTSYEEAFDLLNKKHLFPGQSPIYVYTRIERNKNNQYQLIEAVKEIIHSRFKENIELKEIAQELYLTPNYLGNLFKVHMGVSFKDYLLKVRMEIAKDLLQYTNKRVYEIAEEVGYREIDWFYKKFKQYSGKSANEYRVEG